MSRVPSLSSPFLLGFDEIERVLDRVTKGADGYPPYNIELLGEDQYRITMAVSGFGESDLEIEVKEDTLLVRGQQAQEQGDWQGKLSHRHSYASRDKKERPQGRSTNGGVPSIV